MPLTDSISFPGRTLPIRSTRKGHHDFPAFRPFSRVLYDICKSYRTAKPRVEVDDYLLRVASF